MAGSGNDTITGTSGNDTLVGTSGDDTIVGLGGNDVISGEAGNDTIYGDGVSTTGGGSGSGWGSGSGGSSHHGSGAGSGSGHGSGGGSGSGHGSGSGNGSNQTFDDYLTGGLGNDALFGGAGNDTLDGEEGRDIVDGGKGNDTGIFVGGETGAGGNDIYRGGTGTDTLRIELTADEYNDPNIRADLIELQAFLVANSNAQSDDGPSLSLDNLGLTVSDWENVDLLVDGVPTVIEPLRNPLFTPNDDPVDFDEVTAGNYLAGSQYDALDGDDTVSLASDATEATQAGFVVGTEFDAGEGNDTITGRGLDDSVQGDGGDDTLIGGGGNDTLSGGVGNDTLFGDGTSSSTASDTYAAAIGANGPIAYWRLGENGGTSATDDSGNGFDGTYKGGVNLGESGFSANVSNTAAVFDGQNEYVEIAHDDAFLLDGGTITMWFRPDDLGGDQALFSKDSKGYDDGGHLYIEIDGSKLKVRLQENGNSDSNHNISTSNGTVQEGVWQQVTFTWGPAGMKLYLDGQLVGNDSYTGGLGATSGGAGNHEPITIGASQEKSGDGVADKMRDFFEGAIDEVAIFDNALDATSVATLHNAGINATPIVSGDDVLDGGAGNDMLAGGGGDDTLIGGAGADVIDGGDGIDTAVYSGADGTVIADLSTGFAVKDGQGSIDSLAGVENLTGGDYSDALTGDAGDNVLDGGLGDDILTGGLGNDSLIGSDGTDTAGFIGDDAVTVDLQAGTATGQGDDTLSGIENVVGSTGGDTITGNGDDNILIGGQGADTLSGGAGRDILIGDNSGPSVIQSKTLVVNAHGSPLDGVFPDMQVTIGGVVVGTVTVTESMSAYSFDLTVLTPFELAGDVRIDFLNDAWDGIGGENSFGPDGAEDRNLFVESIEYEGHMISGSQGELSHYVPGTGFSGYQSGAEGDTISDIYHDDTTAPGHAGGNVYNGSVIFDRLPSSSDAGALGDESGMADGADNMAGGTGDDILYGMAGNDALDGGIGSDLVYGGAGGDSVRHIVETGAMDVYRGGTGIDSLQIELTAAQYADPAILTDIAQLRTFIEAHNDANTDGGSSIVLTHLGVTVSDFEDLVILVDDVPTLPPLFTEGSNDPVDFDNVVAGTYLDGTQNEAFDGDDIILFASDAASAARAGYDPLLVFHAGAGNDTMIGRGLNDLLAGDAGDDMMVGGSGFLDELDGGEGNDTISDTDGLLKAIGGTGNDTITVNFAPNWDNDDDVQTGPQSVNRISGGAGSDVINVTAASLGFYIALNADGNGEEPTDGDDSVTLAGLYDTSLIGLGGGDDVFVGGIGDDEVHGGTGNDDISGGDGNDLLFGNDGNDILRATRGHNRLEGGAGNDTLIAGSDGDVLVGGEGADTILGGAGNDTILFHPGVEVTFGDYGTFLTSDDLSISGGGGRNTLIGNGDSIIVNLNESRYQGPTGGITRFVLGDGGNALIGRYNSVVTEQLFISSGSGDDVVSLFSVSTPDLDLSHIDTAYNPATNTWTIDYSGATGAQQVTLSALQVQASTGANIDNWDPSVGLSGLFPDNPNFLAANYIDGGAGQNTRLEGSEGSDIIFGGENSIDPLPSVDFDDFIYSGQGNDILIGGSGYDVYHIGRGWGDNLIIDGNEPESGYANGLILFSGFDGNGDFQIGNVTGNNYTDQGGGVWTTGDANGENGVTFTNNGDGTWTLAFNEGGGTVTFAAEEISEIELRSYADPNGPTSAITYFEYDSANDEYDLA